MIKSAAIRAARTFAQAFLAVVTAAPVLGLDVPTLKAAAVAGVGAVLALAHRLLDATPIPTLADTAGGPDD